MAEKKELLMKLRSSLSSLDVEGAEKIAQELVQSGGDLVKACQAMADEMTQLGQKFECKEIYLPELVIAGDAMKAALRILEPAMIKSGNTLKKLGTVVICTVKGDVHTLGKDIVGTLMKTAGFEVIDLGGDVAPSRLIDEAKAVNADIIACSALMSTTVVVQKDVVDFLNALGCRSSFKVLVGGCCSSEEWAERIGADGYGLDAQSGVEVAKKLIGQRVAA